MLVVCPFFHNFAGMMPIIDAHSHLWLQQNTTWNGMAIRTTQNGRSSFLGEEVQMLPPFMIDGHNTAEVFLSNMNYAQVAAAVVVQELIDGPQNDYLEEVVKKYPDRFVVCWMPEFFSKDLPELLNSCTSELLKKKGFRGIAIPGHRLILDNQRIRLTDKPLMTMFKQMEQQGLFLSVTLADGGEQTDELHEVIRECPQLKIAIGHFGMPTRDGWHHQLLLAREKNVHLESGGITWLYNSEFWPFPSAVRAIREAADTVGIEKLMWGSDYPRTITAITYRMSYDFVLRSTLLNDNEKRMFLGENARRFYGLEHLVELPYVKNMSE